MRVLVLGGTSFIGPFFIRELCGLGHDVTVFHRGKTTTTLPSGVTVLRGDRTQLGSHIDALRGVKADVVVDMIAFTRHDAQDLVEVFAGHVGRAVVASSADVYRQFGGLIGTETVTPDGGKLKESSALRQKHYPFRAHARHQSDFNYSYDKLDVEEVLREGRLPATVLRLPLVYGEGDRQNRLATYLRAIQSGEGTLVLGEKHAQQRASRGYVGNMAHALVLAALAETAAGKTYNVADEPTLTEGEFAKAVFRAAGASVEVKVVGDGEVPVKERYPGDASYHLDLDTGRIREELKYSEVVGLEEGLKRTLAAAV